MRVWELTLRAAAAACPLVTHVGALVVTGVEGVAGLGVALDVEELFSGSGGGGEEADAFSAPFAAPERNIVLDVSLPAVSAFC